MRLNKAEKKFQRSRRLRAPITLHSAAIKGRERRTTMKAFTTAALLAALTVTASAQEPVSPLERATTVLEEAARIYNSKKVHTVKESNYILGLWQTYVTEYKREMFPPSQYDRPYTGTLTIERVVDSAAVQMQCPKLTSKTRAACAIVAQDLSWCKVYIVSDEYINGRYTAEQRKQMDYSYENFLRHELAHCNGWPADHPR
jgi:hypothetical protein